MIATSMVRIGRPNMVINAVAGISISFMVILLLKGLIRGQAKGSQCYIYFYEAVLIGQKAEGNRPRPLCYASIEYVTPIVTQKRPGERYSNVAKAVALEPSHPRYNQLNDIPQAVCAPDQSAAPVIRSTSNAQKSPSKTERLKGSDLRG